MDSLATGFWGGYFGAVGLMLVASLAAFARSLHRVALMAALSAVVSALFVVAYLGWLPIADPAVLARVLAHVAVFTSSMLGLMLLAMLGLLKRRASALRVIAGLSGLSLGVLLAGWMLPPQPSLLLSTLMALAVGVSALVITFGHALRGDRLAWVAVSGVGFMLVAVGGLSWIALAGEPVPWPVHAISAVSAMAYLTCMASALWARYSYLIELHQAIGYGPSYDPVTRMRSHAETGQMVGAAFHRDDGPQPQSRPVGVLVITIGNLYALEKLHGRAAVNHALFVCAGRLRRTVPADVEMGRLADDGFLLLMHSTGDNLRLVQLARAVATRLTRPVELSTHSDPARLESGQTPWVADIGVGLLAASSAHIRAASAVAMARAMSRTAWSYASRIAWFDQSLGQIAELPASDAA